MVLSKAEQSATNIVGPLGPFELRKQYKLDAKSRSFERGDGVLKPLLVCPAAADHTLRLMQVLALFKKDTQIRQVAFFQLLGLKIRVRLERPNPVDQFTRGRPFFDVAEIPNGIKSGYRIFHQLGIDLGKVHRDNFAHHYGFRKRYMVKITAP